jgi:hypothetical protein
MKSNVIAQHNDRPCRKTDRLDNGVCPHWDASNRVCLLVTDGLLVPVEQHVTSYCLSSHYPSCRHHRMLSETGNEAQQFETPSFNRRRSIRIPSRYIFRFSEITGSDHNPGVRQDDAWTIDLSEHGIRFVTRQLLTMKTSLRFQLEVEETATQIEGSGWVIWSIPLANAPLFHAGIAFSDRIVSSLLPSIPDRIAPKQSTITG